MLVAISSLARSFQAHAQASAAAAAAATPAAMAQQAAVHQLAAENPQVRLSAHYFTVSRVRLGVHTCKFWEIKLQQFEHVSQRCVLCGERMSQVAAVGSSDSSGMCQCRRSYFSDFREMKLEQLEGGSQCLF